MTGSRKTRRQKLFSEQWRAVRCHQWEGKGVEMPTGDGGVTPSSFSP